CGVATPKANDVWAVGGSQYCRWSIERWDGRRFHLARTPSWVPARGISASSSSNVWTVGGSKVARWDGTRWASVSTNGPARNISLKDAAAVAAGNAWAIGDLTRPDGTPIGAIAARYEGSRMPRLEVSRRLAHRRFGTVTWTVLGSAGGESDSSTHPLVTTAG